jgi:uncharacterized protein YecA (UPF0149 family)
MELSDQELEAEIARLEALEKSSQSEVHSSQSSAGAIPPDSPINRISANRPLKISKIGRNDPCPCGAIDPNTKKPYKWKKCGLINAPYHKG